MSHVTYMFYNINLKKLLQAIFICFFKKTKFVLKFKLFLYTYMYIKFTTSNALSHCIKMLRIFNIELVN